MYSIYEFIGNLSKIAPDNTVFISDAGNTGFVSSQALKLREGMRYITSGGQMDMGFALPTSIGVAMATDKPIAVIVGDGSFQLNIQELATIQGNKLPITIFVINNNGYGCCRGTMDRYFAGDYIGTDSSNGLYIPEIEKIADAYGIEYSLVTEMFPIEFATKHPIIYEVMVDPKEKIHSPLMK